MKLPGNVLTQVVQVLSPPKVNSSTGITLFEDNFEGTLKFNGGSLDNTSGVPLGGSYAYKITSAVLTPFTTVSNCYFAISSDIIGKKVTLEGYVRPEIVTSGAGGLASIDLRLDIFTKTTRFLGSIQLDFANKRINYMNSGATFSDLGTAGTFGPFLGTAGAWYRIKFTLDLSTGKYENVQFHDRIVNNLNLACYTASNTPGTTAELATITVNIVGIDATIKSCWVDNTSITYV
jgi:hypothetical protein